MKYIDYLKRLKIIPNFWISEEYFNKAFLRQRENGRYLWIEDRGVIVFPRIDKKLNRLDASIPIRGIWSDFENFYRKGNGFSIFLDYEYIYDPRSFSSMEGSRWKVFRKNCKKFPRRYPKKLHYVSSFDNDQIYTLMEEWTEDLKGTDLHDGETMVSYLFNGENRKALVDEDGLLLGLNIWDFNYMYINFRYSICRKGDFLNEYMRKLFYDDVAKYGKWVNDGGVLDREELKIFKNKLNPIKYRKVYSWRRIL